LSIVESIKKLETSGLLFLDDSAIFEQVTNRINNLSEDENSLLIKNRVIKLLIQIKTC
jgi:hypothetical protein